MITVRGDRRVMGTKERNEGIDLLRIVAMFLVMILHTLGQGGLLGVNGDVVNGRIIWAMEIVAYGSINIFALISGYVGYSEKRKPFRVSRYVMLWLMVFTYSVVLTLIGYGILDEGAVSGKDIAASFFPVTGGSYWYFLAYTGLFVLMPVLDAAIRSFSEETLRRIFVVLLIVFSAYDFWSDKFIPSNGYSMVWLVIMYIVGAIIKKCEIGYYMKNRTLILIIVLCNFFAWIWKMVTPTFQIFNIGISGDTFVDLTSPAMVISSIAFVVLFSKLRIKKEGDMHRFIKFSAPAVFAAYIICSHMLVWWHVLPGKFAFLAGRSGIELVGVVLAFSVLCLGLSVLIERGRMALFELMRVRKGVEWLEDRIRDRLFAPKEHVSDKERIERLMNAQKKHATPIHTEVKPKAASHAEPVYNIQDDELDGVEVEIKEDF